jgi:sterol desaturase/sphingolipid hydroxylase (fatty acid hydroxylase superfamily)
LTRDTLIGLALLGWFAALAIAETLGARSARTPENNDDRRLLTNFGLTTLVLLASSLLPLANVASAIASRGVGLAYHVPLPWIAILVLTLLAQTFAAYWAHRLMHAWPLLWRVHRVHHADTALDVSTSLRNHPLELLLTIPASALVIVLIGAPLSVVAAAQGLIVAGTIWEHADLALPKRLDRALALVIVTPRIHRLHHNPDRHTHDSNYGNLILLWDRLFGTFNDSPDRRAVGLLQQAGRPNYLFEQIWSPLHSS